MGGIRKRHVPIAEYLRLVFVLDVTVLRDWPFEPALSSWRR